MKLRIFLILILFYHCAWSQETAEDQLEVFIVIADSSKNYDHLKNKMVELSNSFGIEIDSLGRFYNREKDLICLPEDHNDELYAGQYIPRRYPTDFLSIEYLDYYRKGLNDEHNTFALVVSIKQDKKSAEEVLNRIKTRCKSAFILSTTMYVGCMH